MSVVGTSTFNSGGGTEGWYGSWRNQHVPPRQLFQRRKGEPEMSLIPPRRSKTLTLDQWMGRQKRHIFTQSVIAAVLIGAVYMLIFAPTLRRKS